MKANFFLPLALVYQVSIFTLMMIGICIENLFLVLIEDLKLQEIDSLLNEIYISKVFKMENDL